MFCFGKEWVCEAISTVKPEGIVEEYITTKPIDNYQGKMEF